MRQATHTATSPVELRLLLNCTDAENTLPTVRPFWKRAQGDQWERDRWLMLQMRDRVLTCGAGD